MLNQLDVIPTPPVGVANGLIHNWGMVQRMVFRSDSLEILGDPSIALGELPTVDQF